MLFRSKPLFLFANDGDFGYGHFPLDAASRRHALDHPELLRDDLLRSLVHESLWNAVRDAELDPARYVELVLAQLPRERNEILATTMLARLRAAVDRYLGEARRAALAPRIEEFLFSQMQSATSNSRRIACFRAFADLARSERGRARVKDLLAGRIEVPGIRLASRDRYRLLQTLIAAADDDAGQLLEQQSAADTSNEGRRYSFAAAAAMPDAATKRALFARFLDDPRLPEAWIEEALGPFNTLSHAALTAPLLEQALAALPRIRRERRIFFVNDWLDGFIGGQTSRGSLEVVERFLSSNRIEQDLRLKILEAVDTLERTVRVRERFDPR